MAGGNFGVFDPKNKKFIQKGFTNEILKNSQGSLSSTKPKEHRLGGILKPGQSVDFKSSKESPSWNQEFLGNVNHLFQEEKNIISKQQEDIKKAIKELKLEIDSLLRNSTKLDKEVSKAALQPTVEFNEYQLNFIKRLKNLIANFRRNVSAANVWMESFNNKKRKRNSFWKKVKKGGEQYLFSGEHTAARSAT